MYKFSPNWDFTKINHRIEKFIQTKKKIQQIGFQSLIREKILNFSDDNTSLYTEILFDTFEKFSWKLIIEK